MAKEKAVEIPVILSLSGVKGNVDLGSYDVSKYRIPKGLSRSDARMHSEKLKTIGKFYDMLKKFESVVEIQTQNVANLKEIAKKHRAKLSEIDRTYDRRMDEILERRKDRQAAYDHEMEVLLKTSEENLKKRLGRIEEINAMTQSRIAVSDKKLENQLTYLREKEKLYAARTDPLNKLFGSLPFGDIKRLYRHKTGKEKLDETGLSIVTSNLKGWVVGIVISALTLTIKKAFDTIMKVSKKIVSVFTNAAKQAETLRSLLNLIIMPIVTMFTLMFVPLLIAAVPLIKSMFGWVVSNKDIIMSIGDRLASIFSPDNMTLILKGLDGILTVVNGLADMFSNNASMIDTTSLSRFISSVVLAIGNMIQDILMGVVAFCYSPEGNAYVRSIAYTVGKIIGSIFVTIVALLPAIIDGIVVTVAGLIMGVGTYLSKATYNLFAAIDGFFGGAISGFINTVIGLVNTAINALNNINLFGYSPFNIPTINAGSLSQTGQSVSNFADQSVVNYFNINNNMNVSNSSVLKDVMRTGVY